MAGWYQKLNSLIDDDMPSKVGTAPWTIYDVLLRYAGTTGKCWPSGKTIAKHTGLSPRHVWECTERLEQFGLIRREQEPGKVTVYHILGYEPECITKTGCEPECTGGVSQSQDGLCENKHSGCEQTSIGVVNQRAYKEEIEIKTRTLLVGSFASTRRTSKRQLGCSD